MSSDKTHHTYCFSNGHSFDARKMSDKDIEVCITWMYLNEAMESLGVYNDNRKEDSKKAKELLEIHFPEELI